MHMVFGGPTEVDEFQDKALVSQCEERSQRNNQEHSDPNVFWTCCVWDRNLF